MDLSKIAPFFSGWDETFIWSCLQGQMGYAIADYNEDPSCAQIVVGDFCLFAGKASVDFAGNASASIIIPQNEEWEKAIEIAHGDGVERKYRYAIKKEPHVFDLDLLRKYIKSLDTRFEVLLFNKEIYDQAAGQTWSRDLCSLFKDYQDFETRGMGAGVMFHGELVAGASSYCVYDGGIEIEIDTKPEYRRMGLATLCGAKLILECLKREWYPSWDAHDLRSVALAEKLGYHLDKPYVVYVKL